MQTLLTAIGSMKKSIENLHKGKHPQMEQTDNEFPYPSRGEFHVGGSSKQQKHLPMTENNHRMIDFVHITISSLIGKMIARL